MEGNNFIQLEYEKLEWEDHNFSPSSLEKLQAMLEIMNDGNLIYICHPRHLFDKYTEDYATKIIKSVDFDSINIEKMINYDDFGCYSIVDQICSNTNNQFTYLLKKAAYIMRKYKGHGFTQFSYPFAILERIDNGVNEPQYFVRGIVNCNQKGFSLAFNPTAIKKNPKESVWQRGLRFGDNFY